MIRLGSAVSRLATRSGCRYIQSKSSATPNTPTTANTNINTNTDKDNVETLSARYLASLQNAGQGKEPMTRAEADVQAQEWLDTIQELKAEFREQGYTPSKMFAPPGSTDFDFFRDAPNTFAHDANLAQQQPTETQIAQMVRVKGRPVPPKFDPTIEYLTKVIMRKGYKARAEKYMSQALYLVHLKTREDPVTLTKRVLEDMGPLVKLKRYTDGGARSEMIPVPLSEKQRMRQAWDWILDASQKRPSKDFSVRLAEELVSASKGNSPGFEKKVQQHKLGIVNRSYISMMKRR